MTSSSRLSISCCHQYRWFVLAATTTRRRVKKSSRYTVRVQYYHDLFRRTVPSASVFLQDSTVLGSVIRNCGFCAEHKPVVLCEFILEQHTLEWFRGYPSILVSVAEFEILNICMGIATVAPSYSLYSLCWWQEGPEFELELVSECHQRSSV